MLKKGSKRAHFQKSEHFDKKKPKKSRFYVADSKKVVFFAKKCFESTAELKRSAPEEFFLSQILSKYVHGVLKA